MRTFCRSVLATGALVTSAWTCDLCTTYSAAQAHGEMGPGPFAGVAEQFTHFGTVQEDGQVIPNPDDQHLNSSISQLCAGYDFTKHLGVQVNLPVIYRSFRRPDELGGIDSGTVAGLGDLALLGNVTPIWHEAKEFAFRWTVAGGVKFPTGETDRLEEEFNEIEEPIGPPSGIHGHDLALGSGSFDGVVGTALVTRWRRVFLTASLQYAIRSTGDFDYRFANDLLWAAGPGVYALSSERQTLAVQAVVSGEHKGLDTFQGGPAEDTGITAVSLGPLVHFTWRDDLSAFLGADLPVSIQNTAIQTVLDYRIRAGVTWRF